MISWKNEAGVMVCRMYKALAAFAVTGTATGIATLLLDLHVNSRERRAGAYGMMAVPDKDDNSPWQKDVNETGTAHDGNASMGGALWDGDKQGITRAWKANKTLDVNDFGYAIPEGQSTYGGGRGESLDIARAHL